MDLKIKDVAELLNVSESTIRRWLTEGKIPAYRLNHQYRFSRSEIEDWVMQQKLTSSQGFTSYAIPLPGEDALKAKTPSTGGLNQFSLYRSVHKGGVFSKIAGISKEEIIRNTMHELSSPLGIDEEVMSDLLLDREKLMATGLGQGIGIPHARDFLLSTHHDVVAVVFPERPIAYGSLDGAPVHTLFFLFASDDKKHLHLLAKIAHLSSHPEAVAFLKTRPSKEALLEYIKTWESSIHKPAQVE